MMKNLALILLFVATAASTNAQSVTPAGTGELITRFNVTYANRLYETRIWKAEDHSGAWSESNQMGILKDCSPEVVDNPDKTGINKNATCLKLTVGANGDAAAASPLLYKPGDGSTDFNVNLELHRTKGTKEENYALKLGAWYDGKGGGNAFTSTLSPTRLRILRTRR